MTAEKVGSIQSLRNDIELEFSVFRADNAQFGQSVAECETLNEELATFESQNEFEDVLEFFANNSAELRQGTGFADFYIGAVHINGIDFPNPDAGANSPEDFVYFGDSQIGVEVIQTQSNYFRDEEPNNGFEDPGEENCLSFAVDSSERQGLNDQRCITDDGIAGFICVREIQDVDVDEDNEGNEAGGEDGGAEAKIIAFILIGAVLLILPMILFTIYKVRKEKQKQKQKLAEILTSLSGSKPTDGRTIGNENLTIATSEVETVRSSVQTRSVAAASQYTFKTFK